MSRQICYHVTVRGGSTDQFPDLKKLYDNFPLNIKESSYGQNIREIIESEKNIYVGAEAIQFYIINAAGRYDQSDLF